MINQKSTKFEDEISTLKNSWNKVEIWLIPGWFEVEKLIFGWSLLQFQLVDIWSIN